MTDNHAIADRIACELEQLEHDHDVRILYACESGSRAWGFSSQDSDYDVRFIYVQRRDWYLSINLEHQRDVLERPLTDELDINGWDLRKALQLLLKSNPPLLEWLQSPIVYRDVFEVAHELRSLLPDYASPTALRYHYLHMAQGNHRDYLRDDWVWIKKYFYVLRPLLAVLWVDAGRGVVPITFQTLVDGVVDDPTVRHAIDDLLERKQVGDELDRAPRIAVLSDFIDRELTRLETTMRTYDKPQPDIARLNRLFREVLERAWA